MGQRPPSTVQEQLITRNRDHVGAHHALKDLVAHPRPSTKHPNVRMMRSNALVQTQLPANHNTNHDHRERQRSRPPPFPFKNKKGLTETGPFLCPLTRPLTQDDWPGDLCSQFFSLSFSSISARLVAVPRALVEPAFRRSRRCVLPGAPGRCCGISPPRRFCVYALVLGLVFGLVLDPCCLLR